VYIINSGIHNQRRRRRRRRRSFVRFPDLTPSRIYSAIPVGGMRFRARAYLYTYSIRYYNNILAKALQR